MVSRLAAGALAEGRVSRAELVALALLLLMAGHDTTARLIVLGAGTLLDQPGAVARIVGDMYLALKATDDVVRLYSIGDDDGFRVATQDFEVGGYAI